MAAPALGNSHEYATAPVKFVLFLKKYSHSPKSRNSTLDVDYLAALANKRRMDINKHYHYNFLLTAHQKKSCKQ
jgi:hypothetical protein